jgi:hypothetical protein
VNQISELPSERDFGLEFNYAAWSPGTVIMLCTVPWNSDYRDVTRFENQAALDAYLNNSQGPKITLDGMKYANPGEPIRIDLPLNSVYKYNYLRVFNPSQPIAGDEPRSFYYFITNPQRLAPNTTQLNIQLDVWQTFGYGITFGNCYVERGHVGIANENNFDDYGRKFLSIPEGLDIGGEYVIEKSHRREIASARDTFTSGGEVIHSTTDLLVISAVDLAADPGTAPDENGLGGNPKFKTATGSRMNNLPNGANIYLFNSVQFDRFMTEFQDKPWVTQGIMSIMAVPSSNPFGYPTEQVFIGSNVVAQKFLPGSPERENTPIPPTIGWRDSVNLGRYSRLKKMLTFPYCVVELTSYTGTPLVLKPESWNDPDGSIVTIPYFAPQNPRIMFYPYRYNAGNTTPEVDANGVVHDGGEFLDVATGIMNLPTFSVVNDGYMMFLAQNANTIAFQNSSADWSQQKTLAGATNQYNQASSGIDTSKDINRIGINAAQRQTVLANETAGYNALAGGATGFLNSAAHGNGVGALTGVAGTIANYAIQTNQNTQSTSIATGASGASNTAANRNAGYVRDTNLDYANFAAKGDYANTIAGIQAKVQDAALTQPTTAGQIGGDAFLLANFQWGYDFKVKLMGGAARAAVGEFWLRYGYKVERFAKMPANFMVMEKFTYWELKETYITGASCPEQFKQAIRGIFEKGVTVWSNPADIGTIDIADNAPLEGITL